MADEAPIEVIDHKRGDDLSLPLLAQDSEGNPLDITDWVIACDLTYARKLVSSLVVTVTDAPNGEFTLSLDKDLTSQWPIRELRTDIQIDRPEIGRKSTRTFIINVLRDQTRDR